MNAYKVLSLLPPQSARWAGLPAHGRPVLTDGLALVARECVDCGMVLWPPVVVVGEAIYAGHALRSCLGVHHIHADAVVQVAREWLPVGGFLADGEAECGTRSAGECWSARAFVPRAIYAICHVCHRPTASGTYQLWHDRAAGELLPVCALCAYRWEHEDDAPYGLILTGGAPELIA